MALSAVLGVVAAAAVAALVIMVGLAGGWRGEPRAADGDAGQPWPRTPQQAAFTLRWRATWVTEIIRASLHVIIGLTPAGVAFMQLLAPSGNWLPVAAALMIMAAVPFAGGLLTWRGVRRRRVARSAEVVGGVVAAEPAVA